MSIQQMFLGAGAAPVSHVWSDYLTFDGDWASSEDNTKAFNGNSTVGATGDTGGTIEFRLPTGTTFTGTIGVRTAGNVSLPATVTFYVGAGGSYNPESVTVTSGAGVLAESDCTNFTGFDVDRTLSPAVYEVLLDDVDLEDP